MAGGVGTGRGRRGRNDDNVDAVQQTIARDKARMHVQGQIQTDRVEATEFPLSLAPTWFFHNTGLKPRRVGNLHAGAPAVLSGTTPDPLGTGKVGRDMGRAARRRIPVSSAGPGGLVAGFPHETSSRPPLGISSPAPLPGRALAIEQIPIFLP